MSTASLPPAASESIDFGRCFRVVTDDPDWVKKVLIGGAFTLLAYLLVGAFFIAGYWARLLKRAAAGEARPLPDWDDLGGIFGEGLKLVGLYLVYYLGVGLVIGSMGCVLALFAGGIGALSGSHDAESALGVLGGIGLVGLYALLLVVGLLLALYLPAAFVRVVMRDSFAEGFAFGANFAFIRANLGNYLLSLVLLLVASFVAQFGVLLCCIGVFPAAFWAYCIFGYALGETVRLNPHSV